MPHFGELFHFIPTAAPSINATPLPPPVPWTPSSMKCLTAQFELIYLVVLLLSSLSIANQRVSTYLLLPGRVLTPFAPFLDCQRPMLGLVWQHERC